MTPKLIQACLFAVACFFSTNLNAQFENIADTLYGLQWEMLPFPSNHAGNYEKNGNTYYCVAKGGLWFSNNEGLTFEEHPQFGQDAGVVTVVANNGVLVIETNRLISDLGSTTVQYRDYYRSADNGATWTLVLTLDATLSSNCRRFVATLRLNNSGVFYINWLNENCNVPSQNFQRILFSPDNGLTWTMRSDIGRRNTAVLGNTVYNFDKLSNQLYMTIVYDNNFSQVETVNLTLPGNFTLNSNVSLAVKHNNTFLVYDYAGILYQTTDYGANWTSTALPLATTDYVGTQCFGNDIYFYTNKGLWRSQVDAPLVLTQLYDKGVSLTFQPIQKPGGELWMRNHVKITQRSLNNGVTWEPRAINIPSVSSGLRQWCDYLAVGTSNIDTIVFRSQAGGNWEQLPATTIGDYYFYKYLGESHGYLFRRSNASLIERSADCGFSWEPIPQQLTSLQNVNFLQALNHQNKLYVWYPNAPSIFVTDDGGASWTTRPMNTFLKSLHAQGDTLVYSGGTNNNYTTLVGISTNGGTTWTPTAANLPSLAYQGLIFHNRKWYKLQSGQNFDVHVSDDWGQTWVQTCTDFYPYELYNTNYETILDGVIFIHAAKGLYLSANDGVNWMRLPNLPFHSATSDTILEGAWDYLLKDGYLYAQSFDDGIWRTPWQTIKDALVVAQGQYGVLSGKVFLDKNGDCIIDGTSIPLVNKIIGFEPGGRFANVQSDGWFRTALPAGVYDVIAVTDSLVVNVCAPVNGIQVTAGQSDTVEIVHTLKPDVHNLCVEVFNNDPARPGFNIRYTVVVRNLGSEPEGPVTLFLNFDQSQLTFLSGPPGSSASAGVVMFEVPYIDILQQTTYVFEFEVSPQTALGTELSLTATLPLYNDIQPENNNASVRIIVAGAYDPNDKTLLSEAPFVPGEVHDLLYRIRFQNTGTDTAFTVRLLDTIDTRLDLLTLETVHASYDYVFNIRNNRVAEWTFKNILLPDSTTNEPESHGHVVFRIRSKPLELGDSIPNRAGIYFDYNDPVITNTAQAEIEKRVVLTNVDVELCEGNVFDGQTIAGNTTVYDTTSTAQTDSVFAFRITAHPTYNDQYYVRLKRGSPFFDLIITRDTVISFQTLSAEGCDSTVTFNIHVLPGKPVAGSVGQLSVAPNPASTGTLVSFTPDSGNTPKLLSWRLYDQRGVLLQSGPFAGDAVWLDRGACPPGTYHVVLLDENTHTVVGSSKLIWTP